MAVMRIRFAALRLIARTSALALYPRPKFPHKYNFCFKSIASTSTVSCNLCMVHLPNQELILLAQVTFQSTSTTISPHKRKVLCIWQRDSLHTTLFTAAHFHASTARCSSPLPMVGQALVEPAAGWTFLLHSPQRLPGNLRIE